MGLGVGLYSFGDLLAPPFVFSLLLLLCSSSGALAPAGLLSGFSGVVKERPGCGWWTDHSPFSSVCNQPGLTSAMHVQSLLFLIHSVPIYRFGVTLLIALSRAAMQ